MSKSNGSQSGKIALITGANKGIGLETARQLGALGATVLLGSRDLKKGEAATANLVAEGLHALAVKLDVDNEADRNAVADFIRNQFGRLDILVNNAGISGETLGKNTTLTTSEETLRKTFNTNFFAAVAMTNAVLPLLKKSAAARIVNVSSILGSLTLQATDSLGTQMFAYDTTKTALNAYTVHLANALKDTKIKVNSAHPGWVKTDLGSDAAPMNVVDGAKTEVELATLPEDGPTGGFFHMGKPLPW